MSSFLAVLLLWRVRVPFIYIKCFRYCDVQRLHCKTAVLFLFLYGQLMPKIMFLFAFTCVLWSSPPRFSCKQNAVRVGIIHRICLYIYNTWSMSCIFVFSGRLVCYFLLINITRSLSGSPAFTPAFSGDRVAQSLAFCFV